MALKDERLIAENALGEIFRFFHIKLKDVPDEIKDPEERLEYMTRPYGIMRREVKLTGNWHEDAWGPMLGARKSDGSPVAFIPGKRTGYTCLDPRTNQRVRITARNLGDYEEEAVVFYKPLPLRELKKRDLAAYIGGLISGRDIFMILMASAVAALLGMISPWLYKQLFSGVIMSGSLSVLVSTAIFLIFAGISTQVFTAVRNIFVSGVSGKISVSVESAFMMRLLSLPAGFFKDYSPGELYSRMDYVNLLCEMLVSSVFSTALTGAFSLVYVVQIFRYAPPLAAAALLIIVLMTLVSAISTVIRTGISRERMEVMSKERGMSYAMISGIQKIRLSGAEKRAFARWGNLYAKESALSYDPPLFVKVDAVTVTAVSLLGMALLQYLAVINGVSQSDFYAFNTAYGLTSGAFMAFSGITLQIAQIGPVLGMIKPILEAQPELSENKKVVDRLSGGVEVSSVSFRYRDDMPLVLDNISLKISPGQYVALVGQTGCGKSTLMRVLLGFEKPQRGSVYYDGRDLNSLDLKSLRRKIGTVLQNGKLFQGSIYDNISVSAPGLTLDEAWEAADLAGMKEDIQNMPMGMFTVIQEGGGGISGGQRQRLMIARAIAPKPRILMFDEATSALDNITQKRVSDSLNDLNCTRIVIAHRLSTIRECDRIIVLDGGRIIEDGKYEELIAKGGFFAELVERQMESPDRLIGNSTLF